MFRWANGRASLRNKQHGSNSQGSILAGLSSLLENTEKGWKMGARNRRCTFYSQSDSSRERRLSIRLALIWEFLLEIRKSGSDCGVLRGAERIVPASEWPLYEKIFHYSSTGWYFKGDNILSISGGPDLKSADFTGKPLLIRKIPKRSASEYIEALSDQKQRSSSTSKIDKTKSNETEDEENNSLRRQTSSTSTTSNYSEQPSMDAIFEVSYLLYQYHLIIISRIWRQPRIFHIFVFVKLIEEHEESHRQITRSCPSFDFHCTDCILSLNFFFNSYYTICHEMLLLFY